jgi:hypothetical protein
MPRPEKSVFLSSQPSSASCRCGLKVGDLILDETGEYEVIGRPYRTGSGKNARVRVERVHNPDVTMIRSLGAHERVATRRP